MYPWCGNPQACLKNIPALNPTQTLDHVTIRPPPLPTRGLGRFFGWIRVVMGTSDAWLLHSAGLDALVLQKCQVGGCSHKPAAGCPVDTTQAFDNPRTALQRQALAIQLVLPIAVLGCCLRECVWGGIWQAPDTSRVFCTRYALSRAGLSCGAFA
jgi:hypothetical protein